MNTCIQCLNFADNRIPVHVFTVTKTISIGQAVTSLFVHINITYNLNVKVGIFLYLTEDPWYYIQIHGTRTM